MAIAKHWLVGLAFAFLAAVVLTGAAAGQTAAAAQERFDRGQDLLSTGDYQEAAAIFDSLAPLFHGESPPHRYWRALVLTNAALALSNGQDVEGVLLRLKESMVIASASLAEPLSGQHSYAFRRLQGINFVLMATTRLTTGAPTDALVASARALKLLPADDYNWIGQAHRIRGIVLSRGANWQEGNQSLERAVRAHANGDDASQLMVSLASMMFEHRDVVKRQTARATLQRMPLPDFLEDSRRVQLALDSLTREDVDAADAALSEIIEPTADSVALDYYIAQARLSVLTEDFETAGEWLNRARRQDLQSSVLVGIELEIALITGSAGDILRLGRRLQEYAVGSGSTRSDIGMDLSMMADALRAQAAAHIELGAHPLALDLIRRAISLRLEYGQWQEVLKDRLVYVHLWQTIDPHGIEESQGQPPEWRRELDELRVDCVNASVAIRLECRLLEAQGHVIEGELESASELLTALDDDAGVPVQLRSRMLLAKAQIALASGRYEEVEALFDASSAPDALPGYLRRAAYETLAGAAYQRGNMHSALQLYLRAIDLAEEVASSSATLGFQAAIGNRNADLFDAALASAWAREDALRDEASEAVGLLLRATMPAVPIVRTPPDTELERALTALGGQRLMAERLAALGSAVGGDVLRDNFRREYAAYSGSASRRAPADLGTRIDGILRGVKARSQQRQVRLYYLGRRIGLCLVWERGELVASYRFGSEEIEEIQELIALWRDAVVLFEDHLPKPQRASRRLVELLFPEGWQSTPARVQIVAHGALWELPVEALLVSQPGEVERYLDDERSVSYTTPAALFGIDSEEPATEVSESGYFFLYPELEASGLDRFPSDPPLPKALAAVGIPGSHVLVGSEATEARVYSREGSRAPWLHFASHTDRENAFEESLSLLLTPSESLRTIDIEAVENLDLLYSSVPLDYREDGSLSVRDVQTLDLVAKVVFLHGCRSLQGGVGQSVGVVSLSTAFLVAGARNVIASHWPVPAGGLLDEEIAAFYTRFGDHTVESNLRLLRKRLRDVSATPYAWGAFSLIN